MRRYFILLVLFHFNLFSQEYNDILRAGVKNNIVNPGVLFSEGKNKIQMVDSRTFNSDHDGYNLSLMSFAFILNKVDDSVKNETNISNFNALGLDILTYGNDIFKRKSVGISYGTLKRITYNENIIFSMKFSLINDSGNLINFSDLDPLYINWLNKDSRQNSYQFTPSIILTGSRYTSSVSYNHFLSSNSNVNIFGNSIFLNFSYDIVSNSDRLKFYFNYAILKNHKNIYSIMFEPSINSQNKLTIGSRNFSEVFVGYGINYQRFNIDLVYNLTLGKKVLKDINLYNISLNYLL